MGPEHGYRRFSQSKAYILVNICGFQSFCMTDSVADYIIQNNWEQLENPSRISSVIAVHGTDFTLLIDTQFLLNQPTDIKGTFMARISFFDIRLHSHDTLLTMINATVHNCDK